jgi:hypothetical protein
MPLKPLGTFAGTGETLANMVAKGRCTIDDLDHRAPGSDPKFQPQNILRDWIQGNQSKWADIRAKYNLPTEPAVEARPSSRDFLTTDLPF